MAVLDPDDLFEQAEFLFSPRRPGPPRQVDVRRAISAAYYGVFHFVCAEAANMVVGQKWQREARYALVYRSVDHRDLKSACSAILAIKPDKIVAKLAGASGYQMAIKQFATGTIKLQSSRHDADYDPSDLLRTKNAILTVSLARSTIAAFRQAGAEERVAFLTLLLFKRR